jgi:hypothetical protein
MQCRQFGPFADAVLPDVGGRDAPEASLDRVRHAAVQQGVRIIHDIVNERIVLER